jgi:hypothetical protein
LAGPDPVWDKLAAEWREASAAAAAAGARFAAVKAAVRALLADSAGVASESGGYQITLRNTRRIEWQAIAAELDPPADLIAACTSTDWQSVAKALRPRPKLIDAHASPDGPRRFTTRFRDAPAPDDAPGDAEQEEP